MPSSPQVIATQIVFDYLEDSSGKALPNRTVSVTLDYALATTQTPVTYIVPITVQATTDQNGYWQLSLVPNTNLSPSNTLYTIEVPGLIQYQISVPNAGGPFQSSGIVANAPVTLSPATTNLTGPITVTGNETVTGNLTVQGLTTLGSTTEGATTAGPLAVGGNLTINAPGRFLMQASQSAIVPGATSLSLRNNADSTDNVTITDAGAVTVRNGFTLTAGDAVITAGRLLLNAAVAKIKGGVTSLSLRNNADSADNLLVTDAGLVTLRNSLTIPPAAGGTSVTSNYGSVRVKVDEQVLSTVALARIPASGALPTGFRHLVVKWRLRADNAVNNNDLWLRFNGDSATNYDIERVAFNANGSILGVEGITQGQATIGYVPGTSTPAGYSSKGEIRIDDYNDTASDKEVYVQSTLKISNASGGTWVVMATGTWRTTNAAITFLQLLMSAGNMSGLLTTYGDP